MKPATPEQILIQLFKEVQGKPATELVSDWQEMKARSWFMKLRKYLSENSVAIVPIDDELHFIKLSEPKGFFQLIKDIIKNIFTISYNGSQRRRTDNKEHRPGSSGEHKEAAELSQ